MRYLKALLLAMSLLTTLSFTSGCFVEDEDHDHDHWRRRHELEERREWRHDHDRDWR